MVARRSSLLLQLVMAIMSGNQMALLGCFWQFQGMGDLGGGADLATRGEKEAREDEKYEEANKA